MNKRLFFLSILLIIGLIFFARSEFKLEQLPLVQKYNTTVLLLPLDSRPPCTNFVVDLGKIANIEVLLPPKKLLDCYRHPGDKEQLRNWLAENSGRADAVIVSIDMLIHGGLWASRDSAGKQADVNDTLRLLKEVHEEHPNLPIYAFNILPRLWLSDAPENKKYQKDMLKYSSLKDQVYTFGDMEDTKALYELERKIPSTIIEQYHTLYKENMELNKILIRLTEKGVFQKLVIGQDDGQVFGIPNIFKRQLLHYLEQENVSSERVTVTKGTDEVALTLLGDLNGRMRGFRPKIFVQYNDKQAPGMVMPYMPNSVATTVKEKIDLIRGSIVGNPDEADFILFVYIGTEENKDQRFSVNREIQRLLTNGYRVALVDLSEHFTSNETVFPMLLNNGAPINQLIAYAGWNTTSNAIGTAVVQGAIFTSGLYSPAGVEDILALYEHNLTFLSRRYLEDYFYLKQVIDTVNDALRANEVNVYDLGESYPLANEMMEAEMNRKAYLMKKSKAYNLPLHIKTKNSEIALKVNDLAMTARFPWDRTFEIDLEIKLTVSKILKKSSF